MESDALIKLIIGFVNLEAKVIAIDVDKNTHFDLKRKYELIATWFDGYKIEVIETRYKEYH